jgi:hypothetical protein
MQVSHIAPEKLAALAEGRRELVEAAEWHHLAGCPACRDALDEAVLFRFEWLQDRERFPSSPELVAEVDQAIGISRPEPAAPRRAWSGLRSWRLAVPAMAAVLALAFALPRLAGDQMSGADGVALSRNVALVRGALSSAPEQAMLLPDLPVANRNGPVYRDRNAQDDASFADAVRALGEVYNRERGNPQVAFWLVAGHLARDELGAADFFVRDALRFHPHDNRLTAIAGVVAYRNNRLARADSLFRAALARDADLERVRYNLGKLLLETGQATEGRQLLSELGRRSPDRRLAERAAALLADE